MFILSEFDLFCLKFANNRFVSDPPYRTRANKRRVSP